MCPGKTLAAGEHELSTLGATVTASRVTGPEMQELKMGTGFVERIDIKAAGLHLRITSAKANKCADEDADEDTDEDSHAKCAH